MTVRPAAVPDAIMSLENVQHHAVKYLAEKFADRSLKISQRVHAACAPAELESLNAELAELLADGIVDGEAEESANIANALNKNRPIAIELIRQRFNAEEDLRIKVRWASALLSLGETDAAGQMLQASGDPIGHRSLFIKYFHDWPGDLSTLLRLEWLSSDIGSELRSGLCAALGTVEKRFLREDVATELEKLLIDLRLKAPDAGTHSATLWTLNQWGNSTAARYPRDRRVPIRVFTGTRAMPA